MSRASFMGVLWTFVYVYVRYVHSHAFMGVHGSSMEI